MDTTQLRPTPSDLDRMERDWQAAQVKHYREFARLLRRMRQHLADRALDELAQAINDLDALRDQMANEDQKRFMAHEFRKHSSGGMP